MTHKRTGIRIAIAGVAIAWTTAAAAQSPAAPPPAEDAAAAAITVLDRARLDALLAQPSGLLLLDVRRADEISAIGGFPAYLNIQAAELERFLQFVPRDRQIVTISNHANRARRAAALLLANGFRVAGAVGAQDYETQGGTLTGRAPAK